MKNDNFYKTLRIVFLILAIVCMALSLFKKARAETIPIYMQDTYSQYIDECTNLSVELKQDVKNYINTFEYSFVGEFYNNGSLYERVIYLTNYKDMGFCSWYGWSGYGNTYFNGTRCSNSRWNDGGVTLPTNVGTSSAFFSAVVIIYNNATSITLYCNKFTPNEIVQKSSYGLWLYYNHSYSRAINNVPYYSDYSTPFNYGSQNNQANVKCFLYEGADDFKYFYSSEYDRFSGITDLKNLYNIDYFEAPPTNSTHGLKVFKSGTHGSNYLYVDYSELVSVGTHTSSESSLFVNLNIDDDDFEYDFDSSDTYYHWDVATGKVYYQLPYSVIGLGDISNVKTAYVSNVEVSVAVYSQGGTEDDYTFYYLDSLYLVGSPPSSEDYDDPSVIVDPDRDVGFTDTQIQEITQILNSASTTNNFDSDKNLSGGLSSPIDHSSFDTTSIYSLTLRQPFFENNDQTEEGRYYLTYDRTASTWATMYTDHYSPFEFISSNDWSQYYDVVEIEVVIDMWEDDDPVFTTGASVSHSRYYYYFYSSRYLLRQMCQRELDIMTYIKLGNQISKDIWELENTRLTEIDTALVDFANNFIPYKNNITDFLNDINNGINSLDIDILGILRSILDAILNLNLEVPEADYTDILEKLDTIIENQDTSDINDDWYQNYREWLYGINENDSYLSPHEYFNNIFGTLKTTFDSFTNNISFNAYLLKVEDFINHISGNTIDNLTIYLRDGIGDPGFNINNNYMYTVGGS